MRNILLSYAFLVLWSSQSQAQYFQMDLMKNRQANKESTRWTLFDWMSQKQKISLWDQWLAMNRSANWFEMQISAHEYDYALERESSGITNEVTEKSQLYAIDLWISALGVRAEIENRDAGIESKALMLNLRLIGSSLQSTHFILRGGTQVLENTTANEKWENPFASGSLKLYFLNFVGLQGEYRHFFPKNSNLNRELKGSWLRSGVFIEVGALQLTGNYWQEPMELSNESQVEKEKRDGFDLGMALIF